VGAESAQVVFVCHGSYPTCLSVALSASPHFRYISSSSLSLLLPFSSHVDFELHDPAILLCGLDRIAAVYATKEDGGIARIEVEMAGDDQETGLDEQEEV